MRLFIVLSYMVLMLEAREIILNADASNMVQSTNIEILKKAYKSLGIDIVVTSHSLSQSLKLSNSGEIDGEPGRIKKISKKFPNLVRVPVPINYVEAVAFGKNKDISIKKWAELKPYKIGVVKGVKFIEGPTKDMNKVVYTSFKKAFKDLDIGKIDLVVCPKVTGRFVVQTQKYHEIFKVSRALKRLHLYHFLHKKNASLVASLTPILKEIKKSGEISYIRAAYIRKRTK
ncbi:transporter substrate-binding domain-containing protein, partial [Sulfurimonas sp. MAG313]